MFNRFLKKKKSNDAASAQAVLAESDSVLKGILKREEDVAFLFVSSAPSETDNPPFALSCRRKEILAAGSAPRCETCDKRPMQGSEYKGTVLTAGDGRSPRTCHSAKLSLFWTMEPASWRPRIASILVMEVKQVTNKVFRSARTSCAEKVLVDLYHAAERESIKRSELDTEDQARCSGSSPILSARGCTEASDIPFANKYEAIVHVRSMASCRISTAGKPREPLTFSRPPLTPQTPPTPPITLTKARVRVWWGEARRRAAYPVATSAIQPDGQWWQTARRAYSLCLRAGAEQDVDSLGYSPHQIRDIKLMRRKPQGFNIVAGLRDRVNRLPCRWP